MFAKCQIYLTYLIFTPKYKHNMQTVKTYTQYKICLILNKIPKQSKLKQHSKYKQLFISL